MYSRKFTLTFHLFATMFLINCVTSETDQDGSSRLDANESLITTAANNMFVATTPKISPRQSSGRYEDETDEEDETMEEQQQIVQSRQLSDGTNPLLEIFNAITSAILRSATSAAQKSGTQLIGFDRNEELVRDNGGVDDNDSVTENAYDASNITERAVEEGRYIKGDPLNGYYDFIITEGSYKFWVVFQLGTAALLIYSTLAAIYYSKVNPLTSDYDYVDYLSRSFHGRAISEDSADVDDEGERKIESGRTYLSSLANNQWVRAAAYGFQFAMNAIDKIPK